jgi:hypothetical protein
MKISRAALASLTLMGGGAAHAQYGTPPAPQPQTAAPQPSPAQPAATPAGRQYNISRREQLALNPLLAAANANDWPTVQTSLPAVIEAARSADAKYVIGQIRLRMGISLNDRAIQAQAIDELIASGGAQPSEMQGLLENQLEFATAAGDTAKAARAQAQLEALNPNDPNRVIRQAQIRANANDAPGAIALYQQAMQQAQTAGRPIPVEWRQQIAALAYTARLPQTTGYMRELVTAAPTAGRWHDALAILAELGNADAGLKLDIYRMMRASGAMQTERDFLELGEAANTVRAFGEVQAVYQEGLSRNLITANAEFARQRLQVASGRVAGDRASLAGERSAALAGSDGSAALRLADAYYGYGDYGPAAELYRAALGKGGIDAGTVNTRLGAALALSGDRAGAETAFRAVSGGARGELAQYWLLWLSQRGR